MFRARTDTAGARGVEPMTLQPTTANTLRDTSRAGDRAALKLAGLALWLAATAGLRPLLVPDEGRYAGVAREMLRGDGWLPTLDGLPYFHKPPLFYWLDMAAMHVVGINEFAARFGCLVGAWLLGAALYLFMRRSHGIATATRTLVVLATCPFYFLGAQYANHDMLVAGLITVAVLLFVRAAEAAPSERLRWCVGAWVACGFALLSKGLIGVVLPALVVGPWLLVQGRWRSMLALLHPLGLAAFALVALPWMMAMQARYPGFFDYFIVEQHFRRYALSTFNNARPFWFLVVALPLLTVPWSLWLAAGARRLVAAPPPLAGLLAWWVVAIVGFFSIPTSKLVGYVLPAVAPWCAFIAFAMEARPARPAVRHAITAVAALVGVCVVIAVAWKPPNGHRDAGLALAARMAPGDSVAMIDEYFLDLPFYAGLTEPVPIVGDWDDPSIPRRDNWRKEMFDAARFDPAVGARVLWPRARGAELACGEPGHVWFVIAPPIANRLPVVAGLEPVWADARIQLWRAPRQACPAARK
jgi:4-amino-4-deoxy-L-arabinose transferase-like glycosyltransferase